MTEGMDTDKILVKKPSRKDLRKKKTLPIVPLVGAIAVGSLAMGIFAGFLLFKPAVTEIKPIESLSGKVGFTANPELGDGWIDASKTLSDADDAKGSDRNPLDIFKGSCSVVRTTAYLPTLSHGRGDDFLTKSALFSLLDSRNVETNISKTKILVDGVKIDAYQNVAETVAVAVRAFDQVQTVPEDIKTVKPSTGSTSTKEGMPVMTIIYSCENKEEFSPETWKQVLASSEVSLTFE